MLGGRNALTSTEQCMYPWYHQADDITYNITFYIFCNIFVKPIQAPAIRLYELDGIAISRKSEHTKLCARVDLDQHPWCNSCCVRPGCTCFKFRTFIASFPDPHLSVTWTSCVSYRFILQVTWAVLDHGSEGGWVSHHDRDGAHTHMSQQAAAFASRPLPIKRTCQFVGLLQPRWAPALSIHRMRYKLPLSAPRIMRCDRGKSNFGCDRPLLWLEHSML